MLESTIEQTICGFGANIIGQNIIKPVEDQLFQKKLGGGKVREFNASK